MFANFTEETCTGTAGTLALAGVTAGNIAFSKSFADGDRVEYVLEDSGGTIKIAGVGTYVSATDDITRNDVWNWNGTSIDKNPSTNITLSGGSHTIRCDAVSNALISPLKPVTNTEYLSSRADATNNVTFALATDTVYVMPFMVEFAGSYDGFRVYVNTTGTATKIRTAIFSMDSLTEIDSNLVESADISVTTDGKKTASFTAINLEQGYYYVAVVADGTVTLQAQDSQQEASQRLWGIVGNFSTRLGTHATQSVTTGWTTFPTISTVGTKSVNACPAIALIGA